MCEKKRVRETFGLCRILKRLKNAFWIINEFWLEFFECGDQIWYINTIFCVTIYENWSRDPSCKRVFFFKAQILRGILYTNERTQKERENI